MLGPPTCRNLPGKVRRQHVAGAMGPWGIPLAGPLLGGHIPVRAAKYREVAGWVGALGSLVLAPQRVRVVPGTGHG